MKLSPTLLAASFFLSASAFAVDYKPGHFEIDVAHSKVGFTVNHLVISTVEGRFPQFSGTADLAENFEKSKFAMSVETSSVDTSVAKRDEHLRSADFFEVQKYPQMTFVSKEVKGKPESFRLTGDLTIKGITKKVTFEAQYLGAVNDGFGNLKTAFAAKAKINRKDFGLRWGGMMEAGPVVGEEVTIDLKIEAGHPLAKK